MKVSEELFSNIIPMSACFWLLLALFVSIRIQLFIVKRYERETDLLDTICFKEHATFTRMIPGFFSSSIYIAHLLSVVWLWNICSKKKPFRDISSPQDITQFFSKKEIRRVKWFAYLSIILYVHLCTDFLIRYS